MGSICLILFVIVSILATNPGDFGVHGKETCWCLRLLRPPLLSVIRNFQNLAPPSPTPPPSSSALLIQPQATASTFHLRLPRPESTSTRLILGFNSNWQSIDFEDVSPSLYTRHSFRSISNQHAALCIEGEAPRQARRRCR